MDITLREYNGGDDGNIFVHHLGNVINVAFVLLYRIVKLIFYLSILLNLCPLVLVVVTIYTSCVVFCFNNVYSVFVY